MKMNLKKLQKTSMIFELTTLKLAYIQIFMESLENFFDWFLANGGKNQDEDEKKNQKTCTIIEFSTPKLSDLQMFMKIWQKKMF